MNSEKKWSEMSEAEKRKEQEEASAKERVTSLGNRKDRRKLAAMKRRENRRARKGLS